MTSSNPESALCSARKHYGQHMTYLERQEFNYCWKIHSFSEWLTEVGDEQQFSPLFPLDPNASFRWKLSLFPEKKIEDKTYCSLYVHLHSAPKAVNMTYKICMSDNNGHPIEEAHSTNKRLMEAKGSSWGYSKFIARETLLENLPNDVLFISCQIEAIVGIVTEADPVSIQPCNSLGNDLTVLVEGEEFADVTIIVGERTFPAHKAILAARSSVFAAMFKINMAENIQNIVTITDMEEEVFKELLRFIYTDRVTNLKTFAYQLFVAADKYDLVPLKTLCQQAILANLCVENAAKTLQLADLHQAPEMKTRALQFLSSGSAHGVTDTAEWKIMACAHPHLVNEAFEAIITKTGGA